MNIRVTATKKISRILQLVFSFGYRLLSDKDRANTLKHLMSTFNEQSRSVLLREIFPTLTNTTQKSLLQQLFLDHFPSGPRETQIDAISNFSAYDRDSWVKKKLEAIPANSRVLDAGAGQCRYKPFLQHTRYFAQDFAQYEGNEKGVLKESWNYGKLDYICDITNIPVEDQSFDVVLCTEVLEHVPRPIDALTELVRVLSPGGTLLVTVPLGSGVHQEPFHFYGGFSKYFFKHFASELGLEIIECKELGGLMKHTAQEVARVVRVLQEASMIDHVDATILGQYLPAYLFNLDEKCFVEQFTVGYLIEARKKQSADT
jgi:SAM-dependent methyltransferase